MNRDNLKKLIKESIDEVLAEIGAYSDEPLDPMDAGEDYFADILEDYKDTLRVALDKLEKDPDDDVAYKNAMRIYNLVHDIVENPKTSQSEKDLINTDSELEGMLGKMHHMTTGGSGAPEKMYVNETWDEAVSSGQFMENVLNEKAPPGMEPFVRSIKPKMIKQYGEKRGLAIAYATAWKQYYKKSGKTHGRK
jgi:hypothetical protein